MAQVAFNHLHVHTTHSLLDGFTRVDALVDTVHKMRMGAVAVTDHGNMAGIPSLFKEAARVGIKPIAGVEAYICKNRKLAGGGRSDKAPYYHVTLLAQNITGYKNLCVLNTLAHREGFKARPRIDLELLQRYNAGIICMSGCVGGWSQNLLVNGDMKGAAQVIDDFKSIFTDRFFLEMQWTGEKDQLIVNKEYIKMSKDRSIKFVLTGDSHYTCREDSDDHDTLICMGMRKPKAMQSGKPGDKDTRIKFVPHEYYVKSANEMAALGFPKEAMQNTLLIADMCEKYELPRASGLPGPNEAHTMLENLAISGMFEKFSSPNDEQTQRLLHELCVVDELKYSTYFLIIHRIMNWARRNGLFVGWGRGSSAGSILAYVLGITGINPLDHGLYFERFLNKARQEPPDIDLDFTDEDRQKVIEYMKQTWGHENVAHVGTYSTLGMRQLLTDSAAVFGVGNDAVKASIEMLPHDHTLKIKEILSDVELKTAIGRLVGPNVMRCLDKFAALPRHASVHAAGVIVDKESVYDKLPFMGRPNKGEATQYTYEELHELGYEKFDILGVRTLRVIRDACKIIGIDAHSIPMNDEKTYRLLCAGATIGVFQLESYGYRKFIKQFKPKNFNDIMMTNALYRPGPMQGGGGLELIYERRFGNGKWSYMHESLEPVLKDTYGVMVFQEQVMKAVEILAGWSLEQADVMRKAIGKKKIDEIKVLRAQFARDCMKMGHDGTFAQHAFSQIEFFSRYGWNKAHAAAYGMVTYVTAYLKANHTAAFLTALLNTEIGDHEKQRKLFREAKDMKVQLVAPEINLSRSLSKVIPTENGFAIQLGFGCIKGLGEKAAQWIEDEKTHGNFTSVSDFRSRVPPRVLNKNIMEHLDKIGVFRNLPRAVETDGELYVLPF